MVIGSASPKMTAASFALVLVVEASIYYKGQVAVWKRYE